MLFNSYVFIFAFLPVTFAGAFLFGRKNPGCAALWLGAASLVFYGAWDPRFVPLLLGSILFNYYAGLQISRQREAGRLDRARRTLIAGVVADLALLGCFKYANFFVASANRLLDTSGPALDIVLPLGISFFTFTQIAFLVDVGRGNAREYRFTHYLMFVTYFPHLIAGPLYHHAQMMPQFAKAQTYRLDLANVGAGLSIFILGLAKKVLIADSLAQYATPVFAAAGQGGLMFAEAWIGALAYTLQLYFDFSAYSDMAIGLALMFNVRLPLNFNSPYKATSMIEFWRRWHMTLSAFLRDYLYIPLGGNRRGKARRHLNLAVTMLLGGLWHGAAWTFVAWGGLHGLYLVVNHGWRAVKAKLGWGEGGRAARVGAGALTFLAVVIGWVIFRADGFASAWEMLHAMAGGNGLSLPAWMEPYLAGAARAAPAIPVAFDGVAPVTGIASARAIGGIALGFALCWLFPNVHQIMSGFKPVWEDLASRPASPGDRPAIAWRLSVRHAIAAGVLLFLALMQLSVGQSEFLYFQF